MLTELHLRDYQCHERLRIDLDPRVTTLVGESDRGKSAVLRALRWLCFNRPQGAAFQRHGAKGVAVHLRLAGASIVRHKGRGRNVYKADGHILRSFGTEVPPDVRDLLNVSEDNFQGQHAAPFLLSLSPGEAARKLNSVVNLGLIDAVLGRAASAVRRAAGEEDAARTRLREAKAERDTLAWVPGAAAELDRVEAKYNTVILKRRKRTTITDLLESVGKAGRSLDRLSGASLGVGRVLRATAPAVEKQKRIGDLRILLGKTLSCRKELDRLGRELANVDGRLAAVKTCPVCERPL